MKQIETEDSVLTLIEEKLRDIPENSGLLAVFYWNVNGRSFNENDTEQAKEIIKSALPENAKVLIIPRKGHATELKLYSFASKEFPVDR